MEDPGDERAGGDVDPDEGVAEFVGFLEEAEGDEGDEEPDEEVVDGGELARVGEVFDALTSALGVGEGGVGVRSGGVRSWDQRGPRRGDPGLGDGGDGCAIFAPMAAGNPQPNPASPRPVKKRWPAYSAVR